MDEVIASAIGAAAALAGGALGSYTTFKITRPFQQEAALERAASAFEKRLPRYLRQWKLTEYGTEEVPFDLVLSERRELVEQMRDWYYTDGGGLLMSGRAFNRWRVARDLLLKPKATPSEIYEALSELRTHLKIDLGIRQIEEADVRFAEPEEDRWKR